MKKGINGKQNKREKKTEIEVRTTIKQNNNKIRID